MNTYFLCLLTFGIGFIIAYLYFIRKNTHFKSKLVDEKQLLLLELHDYKNQVKYLQEINLTHKDEIKEVTNLYTTLQQQSFKFQAERNALEKQLHAYKKEITHLHKQTTFQFESIAQKLLDEKAAKFTTTNKENINAILDPLNQNIQQFKKQVEDTYDKESKIRFSLDERIKELMLQTNKVSLEANNLVNALKANHKKQGDWGEMILESILQKSGLIKDREYKVQNNLVTEEGKNVRPDKLSRRQMRCNRLKSFT